MPRYVELTADKASDLYNMVQIAVTDKRLAKIEVCHKECTEWGKSAIIMIADNKDKLGCLSTQAYDGMRYPAKVVFTYDE